MNGTLELPRTSNRKYSFKGTRPGVSVETVEDPRAGYGSCSCCALMVLVLITFSGCGGSNKTQPSPTTYTIGGTVSGLSGTGLVLQNNGGNNLTIIANGAFSFSTPMASGGAYSVAVLTHPSSPTQKCVVTSGSGTANANVSNVQVACTTTTYTIGGTVSGLAGAGLVLQDNGSDNLPVSADGAFMFATHIASGGTYNVTVLTQPSNPVQTCVVTNGSGTAIANVTGAGVNCTTRSTIAKWTWMGGSNFRGQQGIYGTQGTANQSNVPGARWRAAKWTDPSGDLWMFGGYGYDAVGTRGALNDLWKYSTGEWTWMGGSDTANQSGTYGTQGMAAITNIPGARYGSATWTDASGNLWLFGGGSVDYEHNDLWKYSAGEWTWVNGANFGHQSGSYGTLGTASPKNVPGARIDAVSWTDASGNFWLFGGNGTDSHESYNTGLNDLWVYSAGEWTWMGGSDTYGQAGTYGIEGTAAPSNVPGARSGAGHWTDASGNVWLFGGWDFYTSLTDQTFNDLWNYRAGQWTWMGGSNIAGQPGTYGTQGTADASNVPGARSYSATWSDASGNFWLFGGGGFGNGSGILDYYFNDLWNYSAGQWTWVNGADVVNQEGTYGTHGVAAPSSVPGARYGAVSWTDASGNLWLFGGVGTDTTGTAGFLNDLWKFEP